MLVLASLAALAHAHQVRLAPAPLAVPAPPPPPEHPEDTGPYAHEYWFDPRIHSFGNVGLGGKFHSIAAPFVTRLIDALAYGGRNLREEACMQVSETFTATNRRPAKTVVDLCCGTGQSTAALVAAFPHATVTGVDTSADMLSSAKGMLGCPDATYRTANAESTGLPSKSADVVALMYGLHEMPQSGRDAVLAEARRILKPDGVALILDIDASYEPSVSMAAGEPYIWSYLNRVHLDIGRAFGVSASVAPQFDQVTYGPGIEHRVMVANHASLWLFSPSAVPSANNVLPTGSRVAESRPLGGGAMEDAVLRSLAYTLPM